MTGQRGTPIAALLGTQAPFAIRLNQPFVTGTANADLAQPTRELAVAATSTDCVLATKLAPHVLDHHSRGTDARSVLAVSSQCPRSVPASGQQE